MKRKLEESSIFSNQYSLYIYQKRDYHSYQCGPFAIYNLLITNRKHYELRDIIKLCNADSKDGTLFHNMVYAIKKINRLMSVNIREINANMHNIHDILVKQGSIILLFHWNKDTKNDDLGG